MELHTFGTALGSLASLGPPVANKVTKVLWSSWCDAVVASQKTNGQWIIEYIGLGLSGAQQNALCQNQHLRSALGTTTTKVSFFGNTMHEGLHGFVTSPSCTSAPAGYIALFNLQEDTDALGIQYYTQDREECITDIMCLSGGDLLLCIRQGVQGNAKTVRIASYDDLHVYLSTNRQYTPSPLAHFAPTLWCANATTCTILESSGRVYTFTRDPRYPRCLGRPYGGSTIFELVPYLSETYITRIASGGYLTAAVSADGELFLWGQACPGSLVGLQVLEDSSQMHTNCDTSLSLDGEQADDVKCLTAKIDGLEARVYATAVGYDHILVAAETDLGHDTKRVVFAAGDNSRDQLGLSAKCGSAEHFQEVLALRGKKVTTMSAAGWSSFIVTAQDDS